MAVLLSAGLYGSVYVAVPLLLIKRPSLLSQLDGTDVDDAIVGLSYLF